jgi:hypothetical protein
MSAYQTLKSTALVERKARRRENALTCSTLLGYFDNKSKSLGAPLSDQDVYGKIQKTIEINKANWLLLTDLPRKQAIEEENKFLEGLLPLPLSDRDLEQVLIALAPANIGQAMVYLKENYTGRFEGGKASKMAMAVVKKSSAG